MSEGSVQGFADAPHRTNTSTHAAFNHKANFGQMFHHSCSGFRPRERSKERSKVPWNAAVAAQQERHHLVNKPGLLVVRVAFSSWQKHNLGPGRRPGPLTPAFRTHTSQRWDPAASGDQQASPSSGLLPGGCSFDSCF